MTDIAAEVQALIDLLSAAGIRACSDARDANPPCVQIPPPALVYRFGGCSEIEYTARVMVPDSGTDAALRTVGPFLDAVVTALGGAPTRADPDTWVLPDGATAPGYSLTWSTRHH
jgi:hypothetical protein